MGQATKYTETCLTSNELQDRYASYSADGSQIVFESNRDGDWNIYIMDHLGNLQKPLTEFTFDERRPAWHPGGKKVLFESKQNGAFELFTVNLANGKQKRLPKQPEGELIFASYSPSGKRIAASLKEAENKSSIVILNKKGKLIEKLTDNAYRNFYPMWSSSGSEIIYFSRKDTENEDDEIYRLDLQTRNETRLTNWPKHNFCPSWSNDDSWIVYVTSMENSRPEIYVMNADGSDKKRITFNEDGDTLPRWHPFENKILITAYRNGNFEICEIELKID